VLDVRQAVSYPNAIDIGSCGVAPSPRHKYFFSTVPLAVEACYGIPSRPHNPARTIEYVFGSCFSQSCTKLCTVTPKPEKPSDKARNVPDTILELQVSIQALGRQCCLVQDHAMV
jgi:hypothetical protein